jgi:hypothetical protein
LSQHTNHTVFDPSKSSTYKDKHGSTWKISYGDGSSASGTVGNDNVDVGGLIVKGQALETDFSVLPSATSTLSSPRP